METKHTPLYASGQYVTDKPSFAFDQDGARIGDTPNIAMDAGTPELARLIAAGRDLLESLEWIVEFCDEHPEWTEDSLCNNSDDSAEAHWLRSARAAIAKARGL